jgi:hypothetical protein
MTTAPVKSRLVILSIPFQRLVRSHLSQLMLDTLRGHADVLIVSPFAGSTILQQDFGREGVHFFPWPPLPPASGPDRILLAASEIMRVHGYWLRNRVAMAHYLKNRHSEYGPNGSERRLSFARRLLRGGVEQMGRWPKAWRILDDAIGHRVHEVAEVLSFSKPYEAVTLVQAASWGAQDRSLAWMARKQGWRTVFVPYSTDQLFGNGYTYSEFDAVCVQGPAERCFALALHGIAEERLVSLGSLWLRQLDDAKSRHSAETAPDMRSRNGVLLFAGVSTLYAPFDWQCAIVDTLLVQMRSGAFGGAELVLRPVLDGTEAEIFTQRYERELGLRVQWPSAAALGLGQELMTFSRNEVADAIAAWGEVRLLVLPLFSSIVIDAAHLGIASVLCEPIGHPVFIRRRLDLLQDTFGRATPVTRVRTLGQLTAVIEDMWADPEETARVAQDLASMWDYGREGVGERLLEAVVPGCSAQHELD